MKNCEYVLKEGNKLITFSDLIELKSYLSLKLSKNDKQELSLNLIKNKQNQYKLNLKNLNIETGEKIHEYNVEIDGKIYNNLESVSKWIQKMYPVLKFSPSVYKDFELENRKQKIFSNDELSESEKLNKIKEAENEINYQISMFPLIAQAGTTYHAVLEWIVKNKNKGLVDLLNEANTNPLFQFPPQLIKDNTKALAQAYSDGIKIFETIESMFPNSIILTEQIIFDEENKIPGTIDLLVIKEDGSVAIFDYKSSLKNFDKWNKYKLDTIYLQQTTYKLILKNYGLDVSENYIIPIQIYENGETSVESPVNISEETKNNSFTNDIYDVLLPNEEVAFVNDNTKDIRDALFTYFNIVSPSVNITQEDIAKEVVRLNSKIYKTQIAKRDENGKVIYNSSGEIVKQEVNAISDYSTGTYRRVVLSNRNDLREKQLMKIAKGNLELEILAAKKVKTYLNNVKLTNSDALSLFNGNAAKTANIDFLTKKYVEDTNWEIISNPDLESLGLIVFRNLKSKQVDILSVTNERLNKIIDLSLDNSTILGQFVRSYMAKKYKLISPTVGNINLLKAGMYIFLNPKLFDGLTLGTVMVFNENEPPQAMPFKEIKEQLSLLFNKEWGEDIKMRQIFHSNINRIVSSNTIDELNTFIYRLISTRYSGISNLNELKNIAVELKNAQGDAYLAAVNKLENLYKLYKVKYKNHAVTEMLGKTLLELKQFNTSVEKDINEWARESAKLTNPNDMTNNPAVILNELITSAYTKIRNNYSTFYKKFESLLNDVKNNFPLRFIGKSYNWINLYEEYENDLILKSKNDPSLSEQESKLIEFIQLNLDEVRTRYMTSSEKQLYLSDDLRRRKVPLIQDNLLNQILNNPGGYIQYLKDLTNNKVEYLLSDEPYGWKDENKMEIRSFFRFQEQPGNRQEALEKGIKLYTKDLEKIIGIYMLLAEREVQINAILPQVKSVQSLVAFTQNQMFKNIPNIKNFVDSYIDKVILGNEQLSEDKLVDFVGKAFMKFSTTTQLAFSPFFFVTQMLQNMFAQLTNLGYTSFDKNRYNAKAWSKSIAKTLGEDLNILNAVDFNDELNRIYGISDIEPAFLAQKLNTSKLFISKIGRSMNVYPDFMWRTIHFRAQMIHDGVDDAFVVKDGKLIYDEKKDKRWEALFNSDKNSDEFKKAKLLYDAELKQMNKEDNADYKKMPRPYSFKVAESIKKEADNMYGVQSQKDRMMFSYGILGAMIFQMKHWLTAKRNQYWHFNNKGINIVGNYEIVEVPMLDNDGNSTDKTEKIAVWKGKYHEGIFQTIGFIFQDILHNSGKNLKNLEDYRKGNLFKLTSDLMLFSTLWALGEFLKNLIEQNEKRKKALYGEYKAGNSIQESFLKVYINSYQDLFFLNNISSAFSGIVALNISSRFYDALSRDLTSDQMLGTNLLQFAGATRWMKPLIFPEE